MRILPLGEALVHPLVEQSSVNDWNPHTIYNWLRTCARCRVLGDIFDAPMLLTDRGLLMQMPPADRTDEAEPWMLFGFELATTTVTIPYYLADFQAILPEIATAMGEWPMAATQTFRTPDWHGIAAASNNWAEPANGVPLESVARHIMLSSPLARLGTDWEGYLSSLSERRRYRLRKALRRNVDGLRAEFDRGRRLRMEDFMWARDAIIERWGEDGCGPALAQLYWAEAASRNDLGAVVQRIFDKDDRLVALAVFLSRFDGIGNSMIYQCFARAAGDPYPDVGTFMFASLMHHLHGPGHDPELRTVDPTCRTTFEELSIDRYKRSIINEDRWLPMLTMVTPETLAAHPMGEPFYHTPNGWMGQDAPTWWGEGV